MSSSRLSRAKKLEYQRFGGNLDSGRQAAYDGSTRGAMNPNKALWEKGDFTQIAAFMRESGEALIQSLRVSTPLRALDLGCGDGTTAVPLARQGADVTGIDIARNLVEA